MESRSTGNRRARGIRKLFRHRCNVNYLMKYLDNILPLSSQRAVPVLTLPVLSCSTCTPPPGPMHTPLTPYPLPWTHSRFCYSQLDSHYSVTRNMTCSNNARSSAIHPDPLHRARHHRRIAWLRDSDADVTKPLPVPFRKGQREGSNYNRSLCQIVRGKLEWGFPQRHDLANHGETVKGESRREFDL